MHSISNYSLARQSGFTLIELIIIVIIISILATISIPVYRSYVKKGQSNACLSEVRSYSIQVYLSINDPDGTVLPIAPVVSACQSITDAAGWTLLTQRKILATAKSPSNARIECDIPNGAPCHVLP